MLSGFLRVNTAAYVTLVGYYYFTFMVLANIDPYIQESGRELIFLIGPFHTYVYWPIFFHFPSVILCLLTIFDHPFFQCSFMFDFLLQKHVYPDIVDNYCNPLGLSTDFSVSELVNHIKNSGFTAVVSRIPDRQMSMISEEITPL